MRRLSFGEWREREIEARAETVVACPVCDEDPDYNCWRCAGNLQLSLKQLSEVELDEFFGPAEYVRVAARDVVALAVWRGAAPAELLVEQGFVPRSIPGRLPGLRRAAVTHPLGVGGEWRVVELCQSEDPWRELAANA